MNEEYILLMTVGLLYAGVLIIVFLKRDWPLLTKWLIRAHVIFFVMTVTLIILFLTSGRTFRGIYSDRIIFLGLLVTGAFGFAISRTKSRWTRIYFGTYLFYPIVAATAFFIDRIMFVMIASPVIVSVILPETYYKDDRFEIRDNVGIMAPHLLMLVEKDWLTEKDIGRHGYDEDIEHHYTIRRIEIVKAANDSVNVKFHYEDTARFVTFRPLR